MASVTSDREADRAAVVLDFRDFTEDLPADLLRSLNLIRTLNERCNRYMTRYNELVKTYQSALDIPERERPSTGNILREMIRLQELNYSCRQTSAAEAVRFHDTIEMNYHRMTNIHEQLKALPTPPSRDPTPEPLPSAEVSRPRAGRNPQALILNPPNPSRYATNGIPKKTLKISMGTRPSAGADESDEERNRAPSARKQTPQKAANRPPRPPREPTRGPRVSASVPEPPRPPEDAVPGSEHKPWTRLTEWEMWRLRKKMKKNSAWEPSPVMVKRTLAEGGRGDENYEAAKTEAEAKGIELLDCDREKRAPPPVVEPPPPKPPPPQGTIEVVQNRGMKLNEAKKVKRDQLAEERAREQAQNAARQTEQAAKRLSDMGKALKKVFDLSNIPPDRAASSPILNSGGKITVKKEPSTGKKRKADSMSTMQSPSADVQKNAVKKRKPDTSPMPVPPLVATTSAPPSSAPSTLNVSVEPTPLNDSVNLGLKMPLTSAGSTALSSPLSPKRPSSSAKQTPAAPNPVPIPVTNPVINLVTTPPPPASRSSSRRSTRLSSASLTETPAGGEPTQPKVIPPATPSAPPAPSVPPTTRVLRGASTPAVQKQAVKEKTEKEKPEKEKTPTHRPPTADSGPKTVVTAASERTKRRVPGTITQSNEDGGAKVSVAGGGRRAAAIKSGPKEGKAGVQGKGGKAGGYWRTDVDGNKEWINTEEHELYCVCQDVSYGEMIACELEEACPFGGGWFHLSCVGLAEVPPRTAKWYCPECRVRLHKGENTNGLVGRNIKG